MKMRFIFLCILVVKLLINESRGAPGPCLYDINPRGVIDLSSVGNQDGTPRWRSIQPVPSDNHVYSFNPCYAFTQNNCENVAACQIYATDEKLSYSLGSHNSIQWHSMPDGNPPYMTYSSGERMSKINLVCLESGEDRLDVQGQDTATQMYVMTLSSRCACWDGCKGGTPSSTASPNPGSNSSQIGLIFIIALAALLSVYLITFMLINKFKNHATGLDILPHRAFWLSIPINTLYGIRFLFSKLTGKSSTYQSV